MLASFPNLYLRPHTRAPLALMPQISAAPHSPTIAPTSATSHPLPHPLPHPLCQTPPSSPVPPPAGKNAHTPPARKPFPFRPHTRTPLTLMPQISTAPHSPPMATSSATSCTHPMPQIETPPIPPTTTPSSTTPSSAGKPLPAAPLCFYPLKPPVSIRWGPQVGAHTPA